jgi:hypothetical protein
VVETPRSGTTVAEDDMEAIGLVRKVLEQQEGDVLRELMKVF